MRWDPDQYARYADDRGRPFVELLARVDTAAPRRVVDLGCGPGNLTALLRQRWPDAVLEGVDSSVDMIDAARGLGADIDFEVADISSWTGAAGVDVLISNAALQWVPGHRDLLRSWARDLAPGAWLAVQVPGNFDSPSHVLMREIAQNARWRTRLDGVLRHDAVAEPADYAQLLLDAGLQADVWTTTYLHVLPGDDPVLEWVKGTGLRPVLEALGDSDADAYVTEYAAALRDAYPRGTGGTVFPFRRIFAVAHRPA